MREMKWEKGFKHSSLDFYYSPVVLAFLQKLQFCQYTLQFDLYDYSKVFRHSGFIFIVILTENHLFFSFIIPPCILIYSHNFI